MKKIILKNEIITSFFLATLGCFVLLAACQMLPGQDYVPANDSNREVIPFIRMFYRHLFRGEPLYYTWDIGLGCSTSVTYAFYVMSPVNVLVLLFKNSDTALVVLMMIKAGLSALFMSVFMKKCVGLYSCWNIAFSILYAFSNYQFMMFQNICLSDVVWLLPLLLACIVEFIRDEITEFHLSLCYALCFITQFYAGYLVGIYSMFFLIGMIILKRKALSSAKVKILLLRWILAVFAAIFVSMVVLWPMLVTYFMNGGSAWNSFGTDRKIDIFALISSMFWGRGNIWYEETPALYCGIATVLFLPSYFTNKCIRKTERILLFGALVALTASIFIEPIYEFWHLFNRPDGYTARFSILIIFTCITAAGRGKAFSDRLERRIGDKVKGINIYEMTAVFMLLLTAGMYIYWSVTEQVSFAHPFRLLVGNIVFIILWMIIEMLRRSRGKLAVKLLVVLVAMAEAVMAGFFPVNESGKMSSEKSKMIADKMYSVADIISNDTEGFYRTHISEADINQGAAYGFNGVSLFSSENYGDLLYTMFRLGDCVTPFSFSQTGGTDFTDMLWGIKYRGNIESDVYINKRALPIGVAVKDDIFNLKRENAGIDPFEELNSLANLLCEGSVVYIPLEVNSYQTYNTSFGIEDAGSGFIDNLVEDEPGGIIINSEDKEYTHAYAFIASASLVSSADEGTVGIVEKNQSGDIVICSDYDRCGNGIRHLTDSPAIIEMEVAEYGHRLRIIDYDKPEHTYSFEKLCLYGQDDVALDHIFSELSSNELMLEDIDQGFLQGTIDMPIDKSVLFLTVPYDRCWRAWVDGEQVEIRKAVYGSFCAIAVPEGHHEIVMKYVLPWAWIKWVFLSLGISSWLILLLRGIRWNESR